MHVHMAVHTDADPIKTFMRQMIPHHQNAVSMAKRLMKHAPDADDDVKALLREIMAVQNHQIQTMQGYLDGADARRRYQVLLLARRAAGRPTACAPSSSASCTPTAPEPASSA